MHRITKADLQLRIDTLNEITGQPMEAWNPVRREDGGLAANAGHYYLQWAYGGVRVEQMCEGGGARDITPRGTKRETYARLVALIEGIRIGQKTAPPGIVGGDLLADGGPLYQENDTMETTTHTPGPWTYTEHIGRTDLTVDFSIGPDVRHIQGPETVGDLAAHVSETGISCSNPSTLMPVDEAEAHARLIAAAPELLQVALDYVLLCDLHAWEGHVLDTAREAIAKATGGEA